MYWWLRFPLNLSAKIYCLRSLCMCVYQPWQILRLCISWLHTQKRRIWFLGHQNAFLFYHLGFSYKFQIQKSSGKAPRIADFLRWAGLYADAFKGLRKLRGSCPPKKVDILKVLQIILRDSKFKGLQIILMDAQVV